MDDAGSTRISFTTYGNLLTLARLLLLPLIVAGVATKTGWLTVAAMAVALVTDLIDGRIARWLNQASNFGRTLDSTVDFVLIYSLFIAFYSAGRLATYQFAVIYAAMLMNLMLQISSTSANIGEENARTRFGKPTGALQYLYLLFLVVREVLPPGAVIARVDTGLFVVLAAAVVMSSTECMVKLRRLK